jgi:hypothetical protein
LSNAWRNVQEESPEVEPSTLERRAALHLRNGPTQDLREDKHSILSTVLYPWAKQIRNMTLIYVHKFIQPSSAEDKFMFTRSSNLDWPFMGICWSGQAHVKYLVSTFPLSLRWSNLVWFMSVCMLKTNLCSQSHPIYIGLCVLKCSITSVVPTSPPPHPTMAVVPCVIFQRHPNLWHLN